MFYQKHIFSNLSFIFSFRRFSLYDLFCCTFGQLKSFISQIEAMILVTPKQEVEQHASDYADVFILSFK